MVRWGRAEYHYVEAYEIETHPDPRDRIRPAKVDTTASHAEPKTKGGETAMTSFLSLIIGHFQCAGSEVSSDPALQRGDFEDVTEITSVY
mmetsp:Transcript_15942/g.29983  ORF Transcript_15942/g.29983 Transcript_15942/m.29983 type:complete len:90 (+) Transcript_15942:66-335(+)